MPDPERNAFKNPNAPFGNSQKAKAVREQRRIKAAQLLAAGRTRREIAELLGVARQTAHDDCNAVFKLWRERAAEHYDTHVANTLLKIDVLERKLMPKALDGDLDTVDRVLKLIRERNLLLGLGRASTEILRGEVIDVEGTEHAVTKPQTLGELLAVTDPAEAQRLAVVLHLAERQGGTTNGHGNGSANGHEAAS